mgnify:CR=1 FL=1
MKSKNWTTGATAKAEFEENLKKNDEAGRKYKYKLALEELQKPPTGDQSPINGLNIYILRYIFAYLDTKGRKISKAIFFCLQFFHKMNEIICSILPKEMKVIF